MAIEITIPRLGWSMEEGVFIGWLKRAGDIVRAGDPLFSLQGDKATQDIEAIDSGTLQIPADSPAPGAPVSVGAVIGYLVKSGDHQPVIATEEPPVQISPPSKPQVSHQSINRHAGPRSSPLARKIAREHGVDWTQLTGSGQSGRIRRADVLEAIQAQSVAPVTAAARPETMLSQTIGSTRRTIASRLVASQHTMASVTITTTVNVTNLVELRRQFKVIATHDGFVPSFLDFTVKLTAVALRAHPLLNSRWDEKADCILHSESVHVGIAVDTDIGLVVPVIRDVHVLGITRIAALSSDLISRARIQKLRTSDVQGGTFTISNLGAFGVEFFTPIINPPQCAILGMGRIERKPVFEEDKVVGRDLLSLSLTFDHRIVDGAPAARFLQHLSRLLANPAPWLMA